MQDLPVGFEYFRLALPASATPARLRRRDAGLLDGFQQRRFRRHVDALAASREMRREWGTAGRGKEPLAMDMA